MNQEEEDEIVERVEAVLTGKVLKFFSSDGEDDHGAAIFTDPRLPEDKRAGPLGGQMVGRVKSVKDARFQVIETAHVRSSLHYKVRILKSYQDGDKEGWLPPWQVKEA